MARGPGLEGFDAQLVAVMEQSHAALSDESTFRIALIGDWSGRANRSLFATSSELALWRTFVVDRDNLDQVMARLGVKLHLPVTSDGSLSLTIDFDQLDDFHPDRIIRRLEMFERLRRLRSALNNPGTFAEAAKEVRQWASPGPPEPPDEPRKEPDSIGEAASTPKGSLLDQILESETREMVTPDRTPSNLSPEISALAREAVAPYLLPGNEEECEGLVAIVDEAISRDLRAVLHHPDFQALEAAWRALFFLVSQIETGPKLKLHLLDISRQEFEADLLGENDIESTALYKILVEQTSVRAGAAPWAVICGNYDFDFTSADAKLLERISLIASEAGAPFIAAAQSALVGCASLVKTPDPDDWRQSLSPDIEADWEALKLLSSARYLALALPRFLIRLPYGAETEPVEEFDFEETPKEMMPEHESYLWANPTFAIACLLAKAFSESEWDLQPGDFQELEGLALHIYREHDESLIKPCAEILLTVRGAQKIIERGVMPLISMKDTDVVRVGLFQSLAGTKLAGRWGN